MRIGTDRRTRRPRRKLARVRVPTRAVVEFNATAARPSHMSAWSFSLPYQT